MTAAAWRRTSWRTSSSPSSPAARAGKGTGPGAADHPPDRHPARGRDLAASPGEGQGSTFTVRFPTPPVEEEREETAPILARPAVVARAG